MFLETRKIHPLDCDLCSLQFEDFHEWLSTLAPTRIVAHSYQYCSHLLTRDMLVHLLLPEHCGLETFQYSLT